MNAYKAAIKNNNKQQLKAQIKKDKNNINSVISETSRAGTPLFRYTPLQFAVQLGHLDLVKMLVTSGAKVNINVPIPYSFSPITSSIVNRFYDIAIYLLDNGANVKSRIYNKYKLPIEPAIEDLANPYVTRTKSEEKKLVKIVKILISKGATFNKVYLDRFIDSDSRFAIKKHYNFTRTSLNRKIRESVALRKLFKYYNASEVIQGKTLRAMGN
jgi:ankyrin repeat protein